MNRRKFLRGAVAVVPVAVAAIPVLAGLPEQQSMEISKERMERILANMEYENLFDGLVLPPPAETEVMERRAEWNRMVYRRLERDMP